MEKDMKHTDSAASQSDTMASDSATIIVNSTPARASSHYDVTTESDEVNIKPKKTFPGSTRSRTVASTGSDSDLVQAEDVPTDSDWFIRDY